MKVARRAWALAWTLVVLSACLVASSSGAAKIDPTEPALGQTARLHLEQAPVDSTDAPVGLGVLLWPSADPTEWKLRPVRVGRVAVVLPAQGDTIWWEVGRRIEHADPSLLRPLEHAETPAPSWWRQGLALLAMLVGCALILRRWMRRTRPATNLIVERVEAPHLRALRRFDELSRSGWLQEGRFDEWYVEASHALREYVGGRFRVAALDWTSSELLTRLAEAGYPVDEVEDVDPLLHEADGVKFAQSKPTQHQAEQWLERARDFVRRTAVEVVYSTPEALAAARRLNEGVLR